MKARAAQPSRAPADGPLEQALRRIVREEVERALAGFGEALAPRPYVSSTELMESLSISRGTLRGMMRDGLPHTKPGKFPRFNVAEVETWLSARGTARST